MKYCRQILSAFILLMISVSPLVLTTGCGSSGGNSTFVFSAGNFTLNSARARISFIDNDLIVVTATINGVTGTFFLDTGADAFIVSPGFAARLGLPVVGRTNVLTVAGTSQTDVVRIEDFQLGNVVGQGIDAAVLSIGDFDGAIGVPFFNNTILSFDFLGGNIDIFDPAQFTIDQLDDGTVLRSVGSPGFVFGQLLVDGLPVANVRLDTGSTGGLIAPQGQVDASTGFADGTVATTVTTSNGTIVGNSFVARVLTFAGVDMANQSVVAQSQDPSSALIGNLVLRQFMITLDMGRGEVILERQRDQQFALIQ